MINIGSTAIIEEVLGVGFVMLLKLSPWERSILEKLLVYQFKKVPVFYETRKLLILDRILSYMCLHSTLKMEVSIYLQSYKALQLRR